MAEPMASEERRASTEHPVVSEPKEWAGAEDSDDDKPIEEACKQIL